MGDKRAGTTARVGVGLGYGVSSAAGVLTTARPFLRRSLARSPHFRPRKIRRSLGLSLPSLHGYTRNPPCIVSLWLFLVGGCQL